MPKAAPRRARLASPPTLPPLDAAVEIQAQQACTGGKQALQIVGAAHDLACGHFESRSDPQQRQVGEALLALLDRAVALAVQIGELGDVFLALPARDPQRANLAPDPALVLQGIARD
jgi:hypothetical protein